MKQKKVSLYKKSKWFILFAKKTLSIIENSILLFSPLKGSYFQKTNWPLLTLLEQNSSLIINEWTSLKNIHTKNIQDITIYDAALTTDDKWQVESLMIMSKDSRLSHKRFETTYNLLKSIPGIQNIFFSVLDPGKKIAPHRGIYRGLIRTHLGIITAKNNEDCWIEINGVRKSWEASKAFAFDDGLTHKVENNTDEPRIILIIDVERPFYKGIAILNKFVIWVLSESSYIKNIRKNWTTLSTQ